MIEYEEDWLALLLFRREGSVLIRSLYFAFPSCLLAPAILLLEESRPGTREYLGFNEWDSGTLWSVMTVITGSLLSFRTSQALARFWEGTGLLHQMRGEWFDSVSCCVTFSRCALAKNKAKEVMEFRHTLVRLMSLCHGSALEEIAADEGNKLETIDVFGLDGGTLLHLKECKNTLHFNRVEVILHLIQSLITQNHDDAVLDIPPPILSRVYQTLSRGFVNLLNAKKITDTKFPFPFAQLIALLLFLHMFMTPIYFSGIVHHKVWAAVFTLISTLGFFACNFISIELENPFGDDDNDLPLAHFQSEMNRSLLMLLHDNADHVPGMSTRCVEDYSSLLNMMRSSRLAEHRTASISRFTVSGPEFQDKPRNKLFARISALPMSLIGGRSSSASGPEDISGCMSSIPLGDLRSESGQATTIHEEDEENAEEEDETAADVAPAPEQAPPEECLATVVADSVCREVDHGPSPEEPADGAPAADADADVEGVPAREVTEQSQLDVSLASGATPLSGLSPTSPAPSTQAPLASAADLSPASPAAGDGRTEPEPGVQEQLRKSVGDFQSSLQEWMAVIEAQVGLLNHSFDALQTLSTTVPAAVASATAAAAAGEPSEHESHELARRKTNMRALQVALASNDHGGGPPHLAPQAPPTPAEPAAPLPVPEPGDNLRSGDFTAWA